MANSDSEQLDLHQHLQATASTSPARYCLQAASMRTGTNQQIVVDGTISGSYGYGIWWDGGSGNKITINDTGVIRAFDGHGIDISSASLTIDNHGIVYGPSSRHCAVQLCPSDNHVRASQLRHDLTPTPWSYGLARARRISGDLVDLQYRHHLRKGFSFGQYFGDSISTRHHNQCRQDDRQHRPWLGK